MTSQHEEYFLFDKTKKHKYFVISSTTGYKLIPEIDKSTAISKVASYELRNLKAIINGKLKSCHDRRIRAVNESTTEVGSMEFLHLNQNNRVKSRLGSTFKAELVFQDGILLPVILPINTFCFLRNVIDSYKYKELESTSIFFRDMNFNEVNQVVNERYLRSMYKKSRRFLLYTVATLAPVSTLGSGINEIVKLGATALCSVLFVTAVTYLFKLPKRNDNKLTSRNEQAYISSMKFT